MSCARRPYRVSSAPALLVLSSAATKLDETAATVVGLVKSGDAVAARIDGLADSTSKANSKLAEDIKSLATNLDSSVKVLKAQTAAAQKASADPLLKDKIYWLAHSRPVLPTNEAGFDNRVVGIGFEAYYNKYFPAMFTCVYSVAGDKEGKLTVSTAGKVLADTDSSSLVSSSISCASPQYVPAKRTYALTIFYEDADGKRTIPFKGIKGRDGMLFDMVWTKATFIGNEVIVDVNGFDPKKDYVCEYVDEANAKIKKVTDGKFLDNTKCVLAVSSTVHTGMLPCCRAGAHTVFAP